MKKLLLFISAALMSSALWAAVNSLNVHSKTGNVSSYLFSDQPVVTYSSDNLVITTQKVTVEYPIADLERVTFSETEDSAIDQVKMNSNGEADNTVTVYGMNGNVVGTYSAEGGVARLIIDDLQAGTYVVRNGSITYKIIKK